MKNPPPKNKRSRFDALSAQFSRESIDLLAYKLAKKVFWLQAANGGEETFDEVYARISAILRRVGTASETTVP